jgi:hypothetical protein
MKGRKSLESSRAIRGEAESNDAMIVVITGSPDQLR